MTEAQYQLMPPLSDAEFAALKASIAEIGIQVPVEVDEHGNVLDGHHRARARNELIAEGVRVGDYPSLIRAGLSEEEKRAHVRMLNLQRRHLNQEQKRGLIEEQIRETPRASDRQIAAALGVHHTTATTIRAGMEERGDVAKLATSTDTLGRQQPRRRRTSVVAKNLREMGRAASAIRTAGAEAMPAGLLDAKRAERIARETAAHARGEAISVAPRPALLGHVDIRHGDFRTALDDIEPESVDLFLTDPPYLAHYVPLWADMARLAERVLKPGGLLVAYSGQYHLPAVMGGLAAHLEYVWLGSLVMPGLNVQVRPRQVFTASKPVLIYSKGVYRPPFWFRDTFVSAAVEKGDHDWQQPLDASRFYVEQFSRPDWLVCDPFLGAGTNAVAAFERGRRFIGCDVDAAAIAAAWERLDGIAA